MNPWLVSLGVSALIFVVGNGIEGWKAYWLRREIEKAREASGKRRYEWRHQNGAVHNSGVSGDACVFWLASYAGGQVVRGAPRKEGDPDRSLRLFVSATGEQVFINGTPGVSAKLREQP